MKSLKEHILEGILDIENNINIDTSEMAKDVIEKFLKDNYNISGSYTIKETKSGFIVDVEDDVRVINKDITSLTNEFFEFGVVSRHFDCSGCKTLQSLNGAPKEVKWEFNCVNCNSLKTLEGAPQKAGSFDCRRCNSLTSLKGAPKEVGKDFYCSGCKSLKTLEGAPQKVGGFFDCSDCKSLKSLEGAPEKVRGFFNCSYCDNLISLEGAPKEVGRDFYCTHCVIHFKKYDVEKYTKVTKNIYV